MKIFLSFLLLIIILPTYGDIPPTHNGISVFQSKNEALAYIEGKGKLEKRSGDINVIYNYDKVKNISYLNINIKDNRVKQVSAPLLNTLFIDSKNNIIIGLSSIKSNNNPQVIIWNTEGVELHRKRVSCKNLAPACSGDKSDYVNWYNNIKPEVAIQFKNEKVSSIELNQTKSPLCQFTDEELESEIRIKENLVQKFGNKYRENLNCKLQKRVRISLK